MNGFFEFVSVFGLLVAGLAGRAAFALVVLAAVGVPAAAVAYVVTRRSRHAHAEGHGAR